MSLVAISAQGLSPLLSPRSAIFIRRIIIPYCEKQRVRQRRYWRHLSVKIPVDSPVQMLRPKQSLCCWKVRFSLQAWSNNSVHELSLWRHRNENKVCALIQVTWKETWIGKAAERVHSFVRSFVDVSLEMRSSSWKPWDTTRDGATTADNCRT